MCKAISADCSDPANAMSVRCVCTTNPSDPMCTGYMNGSNSDTSSSTASNTDRNSDGSDGGMTASDIAALSSSFGGVPTFDPVTGKPTGIAEVEKGGGKGAPNSGGGGNAAYGAASSGGAGKNGAGGFNTGVNSGLSGGTNGRFGYYGNGAKAGAGSGRGGFGYANGDKNMRAGLDLKAYLPGGSRDPNRGLAGQGGPDGITAANGMSIWQKANRRYNIIRPQMKK
jgi:hypothetical protein